jgi:uncharacterized protein YerC
MFLSTLTSLSSPSAVSSFIEDLLSPTEQIMLGKRLAIAYMLKKGYTHREIVNTLKVGLATVNKVSLTLKLNGNGYESVIGHMLKVQKISDFFLKLDEKIDQILPPKGSSWSAHYHRANAERIKKKRAF